MSGCSARPISIRPIWIGWRRRGCGLPTSTSHRPCAARRGPGCLPGCHSHRVGITGALGPGSKRGIHKDEFLLSEVCKKAGYATAIFGKWHLGDRKPFLPTRHGFDEYFGLPYSNDMWPHHPTAPAGRYPPLPLIEGEKTVRIVNPEDMDHLTTWYTEKAVDFIRRNRERPFFLYVPQSMPHVPLGVSEKFRGKSKGGPYGDVIEEIDWSMGEILKTLEECGLEENTWVIFASDNGPWLSYGNHAGCALPLREGKGTSWDGGQRTPCLMRWPAKIPPKSVCRELAATIDILPTVAAVLGVALPEDRIIDGKDIGPLLDGDPDAKSPHEYYPFFYYGNELHAIRSGRWKLHFPHRYRTLGGQEPGRDGKPAPYTMRKTGPGLELYDLRTDIGETKNVANEHPDVVKRLQSYAETVRADLGDKLTKRKGTGVRESGRVE